MNTNTTTVPRIPVDQLKPAPYNKRDADSYGKKPLADLVASIKAKGIISPITARLTDGHYQIVAGHRRYAAAILAGLKDVPCIVVNVSEDEAREICTIENLQREDLSLMDEAHQILALNGAGKQSVADIAAKIGKSAHFVALRVKLATNLEPQLMKFMEKHGWPVSWWESVARLNKEQQLAIVTDRNIHDRERLNEYIDECLKTLSNAAWSLDDVTLLPAAGSCSTCPKRVSAQTELFADLVSKKNDRCTDGACWAKKQLAHNDRILAAAREKHGKDVMPVTTEYIDHREKAKAWSSDGTKITRLDRYDSGLMIAKKTTPTATPAINVKTGEIVYIATVKAVEAQERGRTHKGKKVEAKKVASLKDKYAFLVQRRFFAICKEIREKGMSDYQHTPDTKSPFCPTWPKDYGMRELCEILTATTPSLRGGDGTVASNLGIKTVKGDHATCEHLFEQGRADIVNGCFQIRTVADLKVEVITANLGWFKMDLDALLKWACTEVPTPKSLKEYEANLSK